METNRIEEFSRERLSGRPAPHDLRILLKLADEERPSPLDETGVRLLTPGEVNPMLDTSYLNERDRADPDIMANVAAIAATAAYIGTIARHEDGDAVGYWFHPAERVDRPARLVRWDHEGQFSFMDGDTFSAAVIREWLWDEDEGEISDLIRQFAEVGIEIPAQRTESQDEPADDATVAAVHPFRLHRQLYNEERLRRGLQPFNG